MTNVNWQGQAYSQTGRSRNFKSEAAHTYSVKLTNLLVNVSAQYEKLKIISWQRQIIPNITDLGEKEWEDVRYGNSPKLWHRMI